MCNVWKGQMVRVMEVMEIELDAWLRVAFHKGHGAEVYE
jgi:hypothetical protein